MNSASAERFGHSQLGAPSSHPGFSVETLIKHLQPHLPYSANNQFENGIERALGPRDLSGIQALCIHETTEVIIVRKNKNLMLATFQVGSPGLESLDNSQKLAVMGIITCLRWNYFPR